MRGILWVMIAVILVIIAVMFFGNQENNPGQNTNTDNPPSSNQQVNGSVSYTNNGFSPSTLTVGKGTTVVFQNNSSSNMWVASDPHPLHTEYPTAGGCIASTFDACENISPGGSFSFNFDNVGTWGYHDHLNPSQKGTIIVQ